MADDSGLCVSALGGAPGVVSAHYAGLVPAEPDREATRRRQDAANNQLLLQRMAEHTQPEQRRARFVSTLVAVRSVDDPEPLIAVGRVVVQITPERGHFVGVGGDGFDRWHHETPVARRRARGGHHAAFRQRCALALGHGVALLRAGSKHRPLPTI
jgi:XTP/dITP diphosphohydrolase